MDKSARPNSAQRFRKPDYWTDDPVPRPAAAEPQPDPDGLSPTRYGDWVNKGIAIDF